LPDLLGIVMFFGENKGLVEQLKIEMANIRGYL
jgi:hypothetical protein